MENCMAYVKDTRRGLLAAAVAVGLGLALCAALPAAALGTMPNQSAPQQTPPAGQAQQPAAGQQKAPPEKPPVNKEEEDAYKAFFDLTVQQHVETISQGEAFLAKFPTSRYRSSVYSKLVTAYLNNHQPDKMVAAAEKAISEDPDNVDVLALVCTIIPRTVDPRSLDADQKLNEAERYAHHAIDLANNMQKPEGISEELFTNAKNEKLGLAYYGLGLVDYMRGNSAGSVAELEQASKLDPQAEPLLFFLLGSGDMKLKKFPDAAAAFDRCANAQWDPQWQARCKKGEADAKQAAAEPAKP